MMGWPVPFACLVACLFFDESQQPTWPQLSQRRKWTHVSPILRHSSQPLLLGRGFLIWSRCVQTCVVDIASSRGLSGCGQLVGRFKLSVIEACVKTVLLEQIGVPALLDQLAAIHHENEVGGQDR